MTFPMSLFPARAICPSPLKRKSFDGLWHSLRSLSLLHSKKMYNWHSLQLQPLQHGVRISSLPGNQALVLCVMRKSQYSHSQNGTGKEALESEMRAAKTPLLLEKHAISPDITCVYYTYVICPFTQSGKDWFFINITMIEENRQLFLGRKVHNCRDQESPCYMATKRLCLLLQQKLHICP